MAINEPAARAGDYAERRYRQGLSSWHRKVDPRLAAIFGPFLAAGLVVLLLERHYLSWFAGMIFGSAVGIWLVFRDSPPRYVERWGVGAEGERKTAKALRPMKRRGWTAIHEIQHRYGNYDHVAVGPGGVYLLETKKLEGSVEIDNGVPRLLRHHDPQADATFQSVGPRTLDAARRIKTHIQHQTGHRLWVQAVVVLWSDFPEQIVEADRCVYIHGPRLREWLSERPPTALDASQIHAVIASVQGLAEG